MLSQALNCAMSHSRNQFEEGVNRIGDNILFNCSINFTYILAAVKGGNKNTALLSYPSSLFGDIESAYKFYASVCTEDTYSVNDIVHFCRAPVTQQQSMSMK